MGAAVIVSTAQGRGKGLNTKPQGLGTWAQPQAHSTAQGPCLWTWGHRAGYLVAAVCLAQSTIYKGFACFFYPQAKLVWIVR